MSRADGIDDGDERAIEISWSGICLVIAALSLTFQLWPTFYFKSADIVYDSLDLTKWGWRSYAVINTLAFIALAVLRVRQNQQ
jgi:hypothetical protein